jgi:HD-GYP domain-containing protein (c-di-GMP phosphodiesterase class II)
MTFPASITRKCDDLAQLLGTACLPYCRSPSASDQGTIPFGASMPACSMAPQWMAAAVEQAFQSKTPALLATDDPNHSVFAIQIAGMSNEAWFGIGRLNLPANEASRSLIRVACEAAKRQDQIESHEGALLHVEAELGRSYCERQWLRKLNTQRATRKRTIGQQSKQAIESLRTLIEAEAVAIFIYSDRQVETHGIESTITGKACWTLDDIRLLLQKIEKPHAGDTVVLNQVDFPLHHSSVRSCVVVPIGETEPIGYVIAINRRKQIGYSFNNPEGEFGSGDAELLHEAAGYLISDGHSNVQIQESEQLVLGTLRAMSNAIEARDPYTHGHSERVAKVGYEIAVRLQLSEVACQEIYLAGILHDIGKIGIPDQVLLKPGRLSTEEFAIIQQHPEIGHKILEGLGKLNFALPGVLYHHERIDGTGYPHRLRGDAIPLMARILAVSDAYDAMTSSRVYRTAMDNRRAVDILQGGIGTQWDGDAVAACLEYLAQRELVLCDGTAEPLALSTQNDWKQVSHALRALQL